MAPTRVRPSASPSQVKAPPSKRPKIPLAILDPRSVSVASYVLTHVVHTLFSQPTTPLPHLESSVAFTHASLWKSRKRSFEEEEVEGIKDNERLELLGNGILQYIITQLIVSRAPGLTPGGINIITQALVSNALLCHVSTSLGLPLLLLADPHESATLCSNPEVQADMFEAFIGGLHAERGIEFVKPWVNDLFSSLVDEAVLRAREWYGTLEAQGMEKEGDWIGEVMKWVGSSKELKRKVEWMMGEPMGPQNTPLYECACVVSQGTRGDGFHGKGMGPSKKVAKRK